MDRVLRLEDQVQIRAFGMCDDVAWVDAGLGHFEPAELLSLTGSSIDHVGSNRVAVVVGRIQNWLAVALTYSQTVHTWLTWVARFADRLTEATAGAHRVSGAACAGAGPRHGEDVVRRRRHGLNIVRVLADAHTRLCRRLSKPEFGWHRDIVARQAGGCE